MVIDDFYKDYPFTEPLLNKIGLALYIISHYRNADSIELLFDRTKLLKVLSKVFTE